MMILGGQMGRRRRPLHCSSIHWSEAPCIRTACEERPCLVHQIRHIAGIYAFFAINPGGKTTIGKRTLLVGDTGKVW